VAAYAFGLVHPRHWQLELPEQVSDHMQNNPWQTTPLDTTIRQRRLQSLRAGDTGPDRANLAQIKAAIRERDRLREEAERAVISRLFMNGPLIISQAQDLIPPERDRVLSWVYECLSNTPSCTARVADGATLCLTNPTEGQYVQWRANDGVMLLPDYRITMNDREGDVYGNPGA